MKLHHDFLMRLGVEHMSRHCITTPQRPIHFKSTYAVEPVKGWSMDPGFRLTDGKLLEAAFLERPNRFLVRCRLVNGRRVDAFLPNPGRLHELLLPGARIWVRENAAPARASSVPARTLFTALAAERDGRPICLDT
ncbi:MAG: hypothetical protein HY678_01410, partial [Chloroflexi bacterium]|nr:hypothetical protein [Chloroflexota bacterium]